MSRRYGHGKRIISSELSDSYAFGSAQSLGYMLPELQYRKEYVLPFTGKVISALEALGEAIGDNKPGSGDGPIPAVFTYFGQFGDHDIAFDPTSGLEAPQDPLRTPNFRTPTLELENLYGRGPSERPFLYLSNSDSDDDGVKFRLGRNLDFRPRRPPSVGTPVDFDLPRRPNRVALIGDLCNDENLLVSQLHHAFRKLHNSLRAIR